MKPNAAVAASRLQHSYFLFIGGSSTYAAQNPLGLALVAFFTILIFILVSYATAPAASCASATTADSMLRL